MAKLLLIGGGGHCRNIIDSLALENYEAVGIVDQDLPLGSQIYGVPVVGRDGDLKSLRDQGYDLAHVSLGNVGSPQVRRKLTQLALEAGFQLETIIDATAYVSRFAHLGEGCYVGKHAVINAGCTIGNSCIINTGADIDHDSTMGDFCHVSVHGVLCGGVTVGKDNYIGAGATLKHGLVMGDNNLIGMDATVLHEVGDDQVIIGVH